MRFAIGSLLVGVVWLCGCTELLLPGTVATDPTDRGEAAAAARAAFDDDVAPLLSTYCSACHESMAGIAFLAPNPDMYGALLSWPGLVAPTSPADSRILTKGAHDGPAWSGDQATTVRRWIDLEAAARAADAGTVIATALIDPVPGANSIPLDAIGLPGSRIEFQAEELTLGLYLSEIAVTAGSGGARLVHPLFVTWDGEQPRPDPADSFADLEVAAAAGATATVGGGLLVLLDTTPNAQLNISFEEVGGSSGDGGTVLAGCNATDSFTANARAALAQSCVSCHGGANDGATAAVNMQTMNDTSASGQATACGQILGRINRANPSASGLFVAVDPAANSNHPFRFGNNNAFTNFRNAVLTWVQVELAAAE